MRTLIFAACMAASPAVAYDTMTADQCQHSWEAFEAAVIPYANMDKSPKKVTVTLADDGWCEINSKQLPEWAEAGFSTLGFQFEDVDPLLAGEGLPEAMALRFDDLALGAREYDASLRLRRLADVGELIVENVTLRHTDGSGVSASVLMQGAYFSSVANMQSSLLGMRMANLRGQVAVNQSLLDDLDIDLSAVNRVSVGNALRDVPRLQVSTDTRQAFLSMVAERQGTLDVSISSERGLGAMQVGIPSATLRNAESDDDIATAMGVLLSGLTIDLSWKSGDF
ncbi:hypothetical protein [Yoonia maritima]|uniref:hypothetical protein n=1 Tax=Yoonia maritima TaxID=1435347 RepID=UPI003736CC75